MAMSHVARESKETGSSEEQATSATAALGHRSDLRKERWCARERVALHCTGLVALGRAENNVIIGFQ